MPCPRPHGVLRACAFVSFVLLSSGAAAQPAGVCIVEKTEGTVTLTGAGQSARDFQVGMALDRGARVTTGADGRASLLCDGGLSVVIGTDTDLAVEGILDGGTRPFGLRLLDGVAGFLFNRSEAGSNGVQIRTPSAVAAVRSTEWLAVATGGTSAVFSREGTVFVFGNAGGDPRRLGPGDGTDVPASGIAGPVVRWGATRVSALADRLGPDW